MSVWPPANIGTSNVFRQSYFPSFVDISGQCILRSDVSMNSRLFINSNIVIGTSYINNTTNSTLTITTPSDSGNNNSAPYYGKSLQIKASDLEMTNGWGGSVSNAGSVYITAGNFSDTGNNGTATESSNGGHVYLNGGTAWVTGGAAGTTNPVPGSIIFQTGTLKSGSTYYNTLTERARINGATGNVSIVGALSKGSGTFDIEHPIDTSKRLVHSFIEGPRCDLIYRGTVKLNAGEATINIDSDCVANQECQMTQGTFVELCANPVCYFQNNDSFDRIKGSVSGNIIKIVCENLNSTDEINWLLIAERKDKFIKEWDRTNENGFLITEYNKS